MKSIDRKILNIINSYQRFVITSHRNPDGDSLGSSLCLYHYLKKKGKDVLIIFPNQVSSKFDFLTAASEVLTYEDAINKSTIDDKVSDAEVIFCLDFNQLDRLGDVFSPIIDESNALKILIDHHENPDRFAQILFSEPGQASTAEMVYSFLHRIDDQEIDKDMAEAAYVGIMTDTGNFRFAATTPHTHRVASHILSKNINPQVIYDQVFHQKSLSSLKLLGHAIQHLTYLPDLRAIYMCFTREDLREYNVRKGDYDGIVNYGLMVKNVDISCLLIQENPKRIKLSLRSVGDCSVQQFAEKYYNGGGHKHAAGALHDTSSMDEATSYLVQSLQVFVADEK